MLKKIKSALISVYYKDGLEEIVRKLNEQKVQIYSTGGTYDFIKKLGIEPKSVESLTGYPSILGGRVKTLHPKVFGGILSRRSNKEDIKQMVDYQIPEIDLVIVDLYPFEETVAKTDNKAEIIEKIDIGGISLIRAAAKNYTDVVCISSSTLYNQFLEIFTKNDGFTSLNDRQYFAAQAFNVSSHYDSAIFNYFNKETQISSFKESRSQSMPLRYGENPHQKGEFFGDFDAIFSKLNGKEVSYNNLLDIDAAVSLIDEFEMPTLAILKHNNACGIACAENIKTAWNAALASDPISAYGGVIISNRIIEIEAAKAINDLFFEIIIAPEYTDEALNLLIGKKNRIILKRNEFKNSTKQFRSLLNGVLVQDKDIKTETNEDLKIATNKKPSSSEIEDLLFAAKIVKHTKSNAIVLAKNKQMISSGMGQTSRVDALNQAIDKAKRFGFDLNGAVMASDAFFPFADCVEIAHKVGIKSVIHPGGSIRDIDTVNYCNENDISMVITGIRHFKH